MANPINVGDVYEVKIGSWFNNQAGINVTHWYCTSVTGSGQTDIQFATVMDLNFAADMKALMTNAAVYFGVRVQRKLPLPQTGPVVFAGLTGNGTAGTTPLPTQVTGMFSKITGLAGRAFRGRFYMPFPDAADNDNTNDRPNAGYMTRLGLLASAVTSAQTIGAGANTVVMSPVIYHRHTLLTTNISTATARQKWATQRKRGVYGRLNPYPPF